MDHGIKAAAPMGVSAMNLEDIYASFEDLRIAGKQGRSETAVIRLAPGCVTEGNLCGRPGCEQMILVLEGEMTAEIEGGVRTMRKGGTLVIAPGVPFQLRNDGGETAIAFAVCAPGSSLPESPGMAS